MYKLLHTGPILRLNDNASIPTDPRNADYQRYLADVENGAEVLPADPLPEPGPSRDDKLRGAVQAALTDVDKAGLDGKTAAALKAVVGRLGAALGGN